MWCLSLVSVWLEWSFNQCTEFTESFKCWTLILNYWIFRHVEDLGRKWCMEQKLLVWWVTQVAQLLCCFVALITWIYLWRICCSQTNYKELIGFCVGRIIRLGRWTGLASAPCLCSSGSRGGAAPQGDVLGWVWGTALGGSLEPNPAAELWSWDHLYCTFFYRGWNLATAYFHEQYCEILINVMYVDMEASFWWGFLHLTLAESGRSNLNAKNLWKDVFLRPKPAYGFCS